MNKKKGVAGNQMATARYSGRVLKQKVLELLKSADFEQGLKELCRLPARRVVNPLFSFLYNNDERIRWRAVTAMGAVIANLAAEDMESARVIIRRLMWNLNDESGGIGWGSPEAMGEILTSQETLAKEYNQILISYVRKDGNFQEHELMQRGVLWGIGRLSQVRPDLVKDAIPYLRPYLKSSDAGARGLAAWIMGLLGVKAAISDLEHLTEDESEFRMYRDCRFIRLRVKDLAEEARQNLITSKIQNKFIERIK